MDLRHFLQQFERQRGTSRLVVPRWLVRALKIRLSRRTARSRRTTALSSCLTESLELRRVLSVACPSSIDVETIDTDLRAPFKAEGELQSSSTDSAVICFQNGSADGDRGDVAISCSETNRTSQIAPDSYAKLGVAGNFPGFVWPTGDTADGFINGSVAQDFSAENGMPAEADGVFASSELPNLLIDEVFKNSSSVLEASSSAAAAQRISFRNLNQDSAAEKNGAPRIAGSSDSRVTGIQRKLSDNRIDHRESTATSEQSVFAVGFVGSGGGQLLSGTDLFSQGTLWPSVALAHRFSWKLTAEESVPAASGSGRDHADPESLWLIWPGEELSAGSLHFRPSNADRAFVVCSQSLPDAVPVLSQDATLSQLYQVPRTSIQTQTRRFPENHRQAAVADGMEQLPLAKCPSLEQLEPEGFSQKLRYVVNPRGPPGFRRAAEIVLFEPQAPAGLLERLRYSISPRGPSLVTVEMQSPEVLSFSGPRASPQGFRRDVVC